VAFANRTQREQPAASPDDTSDAPSVLGAALDLRLTEAGLRRRQRFLPGAILSWDSWWTDWGASLEERAGDRRPAPRRLGDRRYNIVEAAPGEYELETRG
jgi:hypothetical protein